MYVLTRNNVMKLRSEEVDEEEFVVVSVKSTNAHKIVGRRGGRTNFHRRERTRIHTSIYGG